MILKAFKTQLDVNNKQETLLLQHLGCARWAYNWALNIKKEALDKKEKIPNYIDLSREFTKLKKTEIPWMYESSKCAPQEALKNCDRAFQGFFNRCKKKNKKKGFPKFKSKKDQKQSFRLNGWIFVESGYIKLPKIGKLKLTEKNYIPTDCKILSATISRKARKWFVSVNVEYPEKTSIKPKNEVLGIDLGSKNLAICSNGDIFENPKALKNNLKKLKIKQRQLSKKKKGSKNYEKSKQKLAKLHYKISNIRKDCLHKITSKIVDENQVIVLEDLKVSEMLKNKSLSLAISDIGLYEFRRQVEYKAKWNNREVIIADKFYPSSKLCSSCGWKNEDLLLTDRVFKCKICANKLDRDYNASLNLVKFYREGSSRINACGDGSSIKNENSELSLSLNQESNKELSIVC